MTRDTDTATTTTTTTSPDQETNVSAVETAPAAAEPVVKTPRKSRFTGKLNSARKPAAKKLAKPAKAAKAAKKPKQPVGRRIKKPESALRAIVEGRAVPSGPKGFPPDAKIVMLNSVNPCREGTGQHANFEHIKRSAAAGKSVSKCKENAADPHGIQCALRRWVDRGHIKVVEG